MVAIVAGSGIGEGCAEAGMEQDHSDGELPVKACSLASTASGETVSMTATTRTDSKSSISTEKAEADAEVANPGSWRQDLKEVLLSGWPNSVTMVSEFLPGFFMLSFLGSDSNHLAGAGMGYMYSNVTGMSLIIGFGAGAQPLISQAHGAKNWQRCGELLQRQLLIHLAVVLAVGAFWLQTENVLLAFRQPAFIAKLTAEFALWRAPALPFLAVKEDLKVFLQAQNKMFASMVVAFVANALTIAGFAPLIAAYGFAGAPLSLTLGNAAQAILMGLVTRGCLDNVEAWPRWRWRTALRGWWEILALAFPGGALMLCEWWGWEVNLFFAGLLCKDSSGCLALDVFPLLSTTMVIGFMPQYGFTIAASTRVGNALGAGNWIVARRTTYLALWLAGAIAGITAGIVLLFRKSWGLMFSEDEEVVALTAQVLPVIAAYIFLDALGPGTLVSVLRSMGVVKLPALMNFVSFYVVGIPFGLWLTFGDGHESWGVYGLWTGLVLGMLVMVVCLLIFLLCCVDWRTVAEKAQERAQVQPIDEIPAKVVHTEFQAARGGKLVPQIGKKKRPYEHVAVQEEASLACDDAAH